MRGASASRPFMPGYGVLGAEEGSGLLPWTWAEERLRSSRNYWIATVHPALRPHLMAVWGVWHGDMLWFSSSNASRKARNLADNRCCAAATEDAENPVVVEGRVELIREPQAIALYAELVDAKYSTSYGASFYDPARNSTFTLQPDVVFGISGHDFTGSPTRWTVQDR